MSINCYCKIERQLFPKNNKKEGNYYIYACRPLDNTEMALSKYGTFVATGDFPNLELYESYTLDLEETTSKYGRQYEIINIISMKGFTADDINNLTDDMEYDILLELMSEGQAGNVHQAYPDFIRLILAGEDKKIDYNKINNVGEYRLKEYITDVNEKFKYFKVMNDNKDMQFTFSDCEKICNIYYNIKQAQNMVNKHPYQVLIQILDKSFPKADKIIIKAFPDFVDSDERCEYLVMYLLKENETDGNTRIDGNTLAQFVYDWDNCLVARMKQVTENSEQIYYDKKTKYLSLKKTYDAEKFIATDLTDRLRKHDKWDVDWAEYQHDEIDLTDEQMEIMHIMCEENVGILLGGAGCVDCDTEFFDGKQWKKISEYQFGDKVLQYNDVGTASLVEPLRYVKLPCDTMYHFETKYGLNQTMSDDHNIVYWSPKGFKHECNIDYIIDKQSQNGFSGKFATAFKYGGSGIDLTDDEIRLMCAVICDGTFGRKTKWCRINLKKDRKKERLERLLKKCEIEYKQNQWNKRDKNFNTYSFYAPLRTKLFDAEWYNCSQSQLQIICDEILHWDGRISTTVNGAIRRSFSTTEKTNADFVQFAFSACGHRASINIRDRVGQPYQTNGKTYIRKSIEYGVTITDRTLVGINHDQDNYTDIEEVSTIDGYKYCFTVPSHMLVLRRENSIFITGNCGKTSSVLALVQMLDDAGYSYILTSAYGIAAKRLHETTHRDTTTIHRLIGGGGEIDTDIIIIDEASVLAVDLLSTLLNQTDEFTKIVFICDNEQLASISCGNVIQDLLDTNVIPTATLTKVFRYGTNGLATVATDIRNGKNYLAQDLSDFNDYKFVPIDSDPLEQIITEYKKALEMYSYKDILLLSPFNKGGFGTYQINQSIQQSVVPHKNKQKCSVRHVKEAPNGIVSFMIGDKVINKHNNYHATGLDLFNAIKQIEKLESELKDIKQFEGSDSEEYDKKLEAIATVESEMPEESQIANGEIGYVLNIDNDENTFVQFDEEVIVYNKMELNNLLLAYAISCHSSQGCESPCVMLITHPQHERMLTKNLLYVADTRAKETLIEIGDKDTIKQALTKSETRVRDTWLKELLLEQYNLYHIATNNENDNICGTV